MDDLEKLKVLADKQVKEKARIEGKIESHTDELKKEGYKTVAEAKTSMDALKKEIARMRKIFESKIEIFKESYVDELSKIS